MARADNRFVLLKGQEPRFCPIDTANRWWIEKCESVQSDWDIADEKLDPGGISRDVMDSSS